MPRNRFGRCLEKSFSIPRESVKSFVKSERYCGDIDPLKLVCAIESWHEKALDAASILCLISEVRLNHDLLHCGNLNGQAVRRPKMEQLQTALTAIKVLRSSVGQVFDSLGNGLRADHGEENKENKYLLELQELLTTVNVNLRDVEQAASSLNPPPGPFNLGSTTYLSQETTQERQALYSTLVNSYKWTDKVHEYSNVAQTLLSQNSLKRSYTNSSRAKRGRVQTSNHNVPQQQVDSMIATFDRLFNDMTVSVSRPFASNAVLHVTLGHVLKAVIAFKGLMIEWVVVKGYGETMDLWTESRHKVFRKVTENAHAAMLHFYSPALPELAVRSFMTWFHSLINLFSEPCKRCGLHLHSALPPTWRDFRTLEPYHQECKP